MLLGEYKTKGVFFDGKKIKLKKFVSEQEVDKKDFSKLPIDLTKGYDIYVKSKSFYFIWFVEPLYQNVFPVILKHMRRKKKIKEPKIFWEISYEIFIHIFSSLFNVFALLNLPGIRGIQNIIEEVWKLKENAGVDIWSASPKYPDYFEKIVKKRASNLKRSIFEFSKNFERSFIFYSYLDDNIPYNSQHFFFPSIYERIKFFIKMGKEIIDFWYNFPEGNPILELTKTGYKYKVIKFHEFLIAGIMEGAEIVIYDSFYHVRRNFLNKMKTYSLEEGLARIFLSVSGSGVYEGTTYTLVEK